MGIDKPISNDTIHSDESLKSMTIAISNSISPVVKRRRQEKKDGARNITARKRKFKGKTKSRKNVQLWETPIGME